MGWGMQKTASCLPGGLLTASPPPCLLQIPGCSTSQLHFRPNVIRARQMRRQHPEAAEAAERQQAACKAGAPPHSISPPPPPPPRQQQHGPADLAAPAVRRPVLPRWGVAHAAGVPSGPAHPVPGAPGAPAAGWVCAVPVLPTWGYVVAPGWGSLAPYASGAPAAAAAPFSQR